MTARRLRIVVLGLSLSSSWGNGHATTYRALLRALSERGHDCLFLERDCPWYAANRDLSDPSYCRLEIYGSLNELRRYASDVASADVVIVGSYVPQGVAVGQWVQQIARGVTAFYDIDTPVTLSRLANGDCDYLAPPLIAGYDLYLSFTGGPCLDRIKTVYGAPAARALYCSVDTDAYDRMDDVSRRWDLGYLGTYSADRQPALARLLLEPARRAPDLVFVVAGPQYPDSIDWPANVERIEHLPPRDHVGFYCSLGWTLNVTRSDMVSAGYSPSVRLFEAAACGVPILSDDWPGLATIFTPGREIVIVRSADDVVAALRAPAALGRRQADAARQRILSGHTARHRARELERYLLEASGRRTQVAGGTVAAT